MSRVTCWGCSTDSHVRADGDASHAFAATDPGDGLAVFDPDAARTRRSGQITAAFGARVKDDRHGQSGISDCQSGASLGAFVYSSGN